MIFYASIVLITTYIKLVVPQSSINCDGDTYDDLYNFINGVSSCNFPYYNITSDIVRDGCPQLTTESLCPFNADKSLNKINIEKTVEIVNDCLKQPKFGIISMNPITVPSVTYSGDQILQGTGVTGECTVPQNSSFVYNVKNTLITVTDVQNTVKFTINGSTLISKGLINCKFTIPIPNVEPSMNIIGYYATLPLTSKSSILLNDNYTVPKIESSAGTCNVQFDFIQVPVYSFIPLRSFFSTYYNRMIRKAKISEIFGKFIAAIVNGALQFTKSQCK
ncbi:hypothetical protein CHUAL_006725 [Chamberlinius hualienensis]